MQGLAGAIRDHCRSMYCASAGSGTMQQGWLSKLLVSGLKNQLSIDLFLGSDYRVSSLHLCFSTRLGMFEAGLGCLSVACWSLCFSPASCRLHLLAMKCRLQIARVFFPTKQLRFLQPTRPHSTDRIILTVCKRTNPQCRSFEAAPLKSPICSFAKVFKARREWMTAATPVSTARTNVTLTPSRCSHSSSLCCRQLCLRETTPASYTASPAPQVPSVP